MPSFSRRGSVKAVAGALLMAGMLSANQASALTLMQAYQAALINDPTFQSAIQENLAGKENAILGRSNLLPQISASYSASKVRADQTIPNFLGVPTTSYPVYISHNSTIQIRQPVLSLDGFARYKQGLAQSRFSDAQFDGRTQEMILRVSGAYIDALFAREQLLLVQAQRDTLIEQMNVNDKLFAKGEGTKTDMLETQSRLALSEAQVLESLDNQANTRAALSALVGDDVENLDQLRESFRIAPLPEGGFEGLKKAVLENNPELRAQTFAVEVAKQEVNKARAGHAPRIDVFASYTKSNADTLNTYNQESVSRAIGVQVNIPLYSGGSVSAQYRQAVANLSKSKSDLQARLDKLVLDLRKDYGAVVSSASRIAALDKAVASAQLLVTATEQSIKGGVRINLDLLNAKQQLFTSQRDLAQARYTYLLNLVKVKGEIGGLGMSDVREISGYFM